MTKQVTAAVLIKRINRKLAHQGEFLRTTRGEAARLDLGDYWVHELSRNLALETRVDIEEMGRELGVLAENESLKEAA